MFKFLTLMVAAPLLFGCVYDQHSPATRGFGPCVEGSCSNGVGTLYDKMNDVEITGKWYDHRPYSGNVTLTKDNQRYVSRYDEGLVVSGEYLYFHGNGTFDHFNGTWRRYYDPFTDRYQTFPQEGVYTLAKGGRLVGRFSAVPSLAVKNEKQVLAVRSFYEYNRISLANVVFNGVIEFDNKQEFVTLAMSDHMLGNPFFNAYGTSLVNASVERIQEYQKEYEQDSAWLDDVLERNRIAKKKQSDDLSNMFGTLAGLAVAGASAYNGLSTDSSVALGTGVVKLANNGDAKSLSSALDTMEMEQITKADIEQEVQRIKQRYAKGNDGTAQAYNQYEQHAQRSEQQRIAMTSQNTLEITAGSKAPQGHSKTQVTGSSTNATSPSSRTESNIKKGEYNIGVVSAYQDEGTLYAYNSNSSAAKSASGHGLNTSNGAASSGLTSSSSVEPDSKRGIALTWQNKHGKWWACGPVQCTLSSDETEAQSLGYVVLRNVHSVNDTHQKHGRCNLYLVEGLTPSDMGAEKVKELAVCHP